jgi:hypothetical protein
VVQSEHTSPVIYMNDWFTATKQLLLEAQGVLVRLKKPLLDANLTFNSMQGQAQSEDGEIYIPKVTKMEKYQSLQTSEPTWSNTPPETS